jgi:CelD/BcsL family acetyltransferase involved in cellulose biosynthesis
MTMAAAIDDRTADANAWWKASRVARVNIVEDPGEVETIWRGFESQFSTPYQRFDFLAAWQREVGERGNLRPLVTVAYDFEHRPLLLLPLVLSQSRGIRVAEFMGGKHATFNMALWDREFAAGATASDLSVLLAAMRERSAADVLALIRQPQRWQDLPNPMALLSNQPSANDCPVLTLTPGAEPTARLSNSFRRRLKGKERKLQSLSGYRYQIATSDAEVERILDWFFAVKPLRMAEQKLPNVFAEPGAEAFIRSCCMTKLASGGRVIDIHALGCDDEVIAIFAGVADNHRFSMMFNTYTMSGSSRHSPGLILMRNIIDHYADLGYRALDLGIGSDDYKRLFCKSDEPIFDCFIPLSLRGRAAAGVMSGLNRAKYLVKHNQPLLNMARKVQTALQR